MRILGYCRSCHRVRHVRVTQFRPDRNIQHGVCSWCEEEEERKRRVRDAEQRERKQ